MIFYRAKQYVQGYGVLSFARNLSNKYAKQLLDTATWLDALNRTRCFINKSQKVIHKTAEAIGEFTVNKIADERVKSKLVTDENSRNVDEIILPPEKR